MPRNVRNFWIELEVDGAAKRIETGPRTKDGGFKIRIKVRENGQVSDKTFYVSGYVEGEKLMLGTSASYADRPGSQYAMAAWRPMLIEFER